MTKSEIRVDERPHCGNGWGPTKRYPGCNYTGGHFCKKLKDHKGPCCCVCGSESKQKRLDDDRI